MAIKGGRRFRSHIRRAKGQVQRAPRAVAVGFFSTATYDDGTPVTNVAAWNEFGTRTKSGKVHVPARPFFRQSIARGKEAVHRVAMRSVDGRTMAVTPAVAGRMGAAHAAEIQRSIINLKDPPNAPSTIKAKFGGTNPLIGATNTLLPSVSWQVDG